MRALILSLLLLASPALAENLGLPAAARARIGVTTLQGPAYVTLGFPGGDVPPDRGVCTDVVIRALRTAYATDLQRAVNRDMKRAFSAYPTLWGLTITDRNIGHRRVPNLQTLFTRIDAALPEGTAFRPCPAIRPISASCPTSLPAATPWPCATSAGARRKRIS